MKLSVLPALSLAAWASASSSSDDDHFGPDGVCSNSNPTLTLSEAFQDLHLPPQVHPGGDGVTKVQLVYNLVDYEGPSYNTILRAYNGIAPGPTLHVEPGGVLEIELINCLTLPLGFNGEEAHNRYHIPNSTNLHTHGPHVSGESPGDNVFLDIGPQESELYRYEFDENHMPGTFWYHPHLHGSSALQVGQGAAGMIIMDEPKDYGIPHAIKNMPEIQMVFQHMSLDILRQSANVSQDGITNWIDLNFEVTNETTDLTNFMLINMQFLPKLAMDVGKWYRWRMVMSSMRESLAFLSESGNCEFQLLAKDGIFLSDAPREVPDIILSPGNRADVAVRCNQVGREYMNATDLALRCTPSYGCFDPGVQPLQNEEYSDVPKFVGTFSDPELQPTIFVIDVSSPDPDLENFTAPTPCYLVDLQDVDNVDGNFTNEYACTNPDQTSGTPPEDAWPNVATPLDICGVHGPYGVGGGSEIIPFINDTIFINDFAAGSVQEIDFLFVPFHPYHQHINPFQIQEFYNFANERIPGATNPAIEDYVTASVQTWYQVGDWQDTLQYPAFVEGFDLSTFTGVRFRFQADSFTGHMVQHCHLLFHEDQGMMAQFNVTGEEGATWPGARDVDDTCILPSGPRTGKSGKSSKSGKAESSEASSAKDRDQDRSSNSGKAESSKASSTKDHDEDIMNIGFDGESMSMAVDDEPEIVRRLGWSA